MKKVTLLIAGIALLSCIATAQISIALPTITTPPIGTVTTGSTTDQNGNTVKTVQIGTQTWFAENLKTTTYNDGTTIPNVTDTTAWAALTTGAVCSYNNDESNVATYGRLYNWYAVNTRKLCPKGWHVPSNAEWTTLQTYLIANGYNYDGSTTGNYIAKSMASTTGWSSSTTTGAIGNTPSTNNSSGFTALPGGYRHNDGTFYLVGNYGYWWSSTELNTSYAYYRTLTYNYSNLNSYPSSLVSGFSVRCLKDK